MTISKVRSSPWATGEKLTSAQANALDTRGTYALDKRAGQTDTIESVVSLANAGRVVKSVEVGANADTTYDVSMGIALLRVPTTLSADRTYTLSETGAVDGDEIMVFMETPNTRKVTIVDNLTSATLHVLGVDGYEASFIFKAGVGWQRARGRRSRLVAEVITASGAWVAPRGVTGALLMGCGGGGGGGGGTTGSTSTNVYALGGGGGGGARLGTAWVTLVPASSYDVTIGAGGGTAGAASPGIDGGATVFALAGTTLAQFQGAQGGHGAAVLTNTTSTYLILGGLPVAPSTGIKTLGWGTDLRTVYFEPSNSPFNASNFSRPLLDGEGGASVGRSGGYAGQQNFTGGFAGGGGGSVGTDSGTYRGGSGGGGGAAGPFGIGGTGGGGGNGNNAGSGGNGGTPSSPAANTGAGGGGGGAGGGGSGAGGLPGSGAAGGSGRLIIIYVAQAD